MLAKLPKSRIIFKDVETSKFKQREKKRIDYIDQFLETLRTQRVEKSTLLKY